MVVLLTSSWRGQSPPEEGVGDLDFRCSGEYENFLDSSEAGKNGLDCSRDTAKGVTENVLVLESYVIQRLNCRHSC